MITGEQPKARLLEVQPVLMASDVLKSICFFSAVGFALRFRDDELVPQYAVMRRDSAEIHIQWNESASNAGGHDRPTYRILVNDVDSLFNELARNSPETLSAPLSSPWHKPANTPWGTREFHVRDPAANGIQFYQDQQALQNSAV
jgi:hypothetical protein